MTLFLLLDSNYQKKNREKKEESLLRTCFVIIFNLKKKTKKYFLFLFNYFCFCDVFL